MASKSEVTQRFALQYIPQSHRRIIAGKEVIVHCHHYNSRVQSTIEGAKGIDGRAIVVESAEATFSEQVKNAFKPKDSLAERWEVAAALYKHCGFGVLNLDEISKNKVRATASHFVEGWNVGFPERKDPVCSFACGCIQGMVYAVTGEAVHVRETQCMISGASECLFEVVRGRKDAPAAIQRGEMSTPAAGGNYLHSPNVNEQAIIDAVVGMAIHGNDAGLIPAFSVYLANTTADFYNLVAIRFTEEMQKKKMFNTARKLLVFDAETCGMNTFRGIMNSAEWDGLVKPMLKQHSDQLHAIVAISNALGWGNWHVVKHAPGAQLTLESRNGYEALGYRTMRGISQDPRCFMLTGVSAGIMELVYGEGSVQERFGTYLPEEKSCICADNQSCTFEVEKA